MKLVEGLERVKGEVGEWRRELHRHPQTAYEEEFAAGFIAAKLDEWGIPYRKGVARTGVVATIEGKQGASGKAIGLRADIDALNIEEKTGLPHRSETPGKMHACGHDGHTATLLGVARHLAKNPDFSGRVHLVFQPAEEGGRGAVKMMEEGLFDEHPCDFVFGVHNWPWLPVGKFATRSGPLLASVDEWDITITGTGGHAAMPHLVVDPAVIAAQLVTTLQSIVSRNVDPVGSAVLSVCNLNVGTGAFNVIGDTAHLNGTVRTFDNAVREVVERRMGEIARNVAEAFGARAEVNYHRQIDPTINTADGVEQAVRAAADVVGADAVDTSHAPCMGGEDFGAFLEKVPGAFVFVGQGTADPASPHNQGLHSPYYDFNDEILPVAGSYFVRLVTNYLA